MSHGAIYIFCPPDKVHKVSQHKAKSWKLKGGKKNVARDAAISQRDSNAKKSVGTWFIPCIYAINLHLPINHCIFRPLPRNRNHGVKLYENNFTLSKLLTCMFCLGRHHLLRLYSPPQTTKTYRCFNPFEDSSEKGSGQGTCFISGK